jgi:hypothetical protein
LGNKLPAGSKKTQNTSPQKQIVALGSGDIGVRMVGMEVYSNWAIIGSF